MHDSGATKLRAPLNYNMWGEANSKTNLYIGKPTTDKEVSQVAHFVFLTHLVVFWGIKDNYNNFF